MSSLSRWWRCTKRSLVANECRTMKKKRMQKTVGGRLTQLLVPLKRDARKAKSDGVKSSRANLDDPKSSIRSPNVGQSTAGSKAGSTAASTKPSLAGGAARGAAELINLIQSTIEPDSWDVNGGRGSMMYFSRLNVLVIRNTGQVHDSVGTALTKLRSVQTPMISVTVSGQSVNANP